MQESNTSRYFLSGALFMEEEEFDELIEGKRDLTFRQAKLLENYTNTSMFIWLQMQQTFNLATLMIEV